MLTSKQNVHFLTQRHQRGFFRCLFLFSSERKSKKVCRSDRWGGVQMGGTGSARAWRTGHRNQNILSEKLSIFN